MTESDDAFGDTVYEGGDAVDDAENLDPIENLTGDDPDEIMQTSYVPPHKEPYNLRHAPTPAEEAEGHTLEDELAAEEPEVWELPDTADAEPRAGRLVAENELGDLGAGAQDQVDDVGPAGYASSAEEAAVHIIPDDAR
jgi:uncharacterized protein DUF5709